MSDCGRTQIHLSKLFLLRTSAIQASLMAFGLASVVDEIFDRKSLNSLEASCCDQHDIKQIKVIFRNCTIKVFLTGNHKLL